MSNIITKEFDFTQELHKTVVQSLTTSFGLDFLLFEDKKGGDVDTIHNARQGIYGTKKEQLAYENKADYKPIITDSAGNAVLNNNGKAKKQDLYHADANYIAQGKTDKALQQKDELVDKYRSKKMALNENRQLDHIISAHEVHHDRGRILAEIDGVMLANQNTNLASTHAYINNAKKEHSVEKFIHEVVPNTITNKESAILKNQKKLKNLPNTTPQEKHQRRQIEDEIRKDRQHIEALESIDKQAMLKEDKIARNTYNQQINSAYYKGSKFLKNAGSDALKKGVSMGARQAIGLVLAELWFELREQIPQIYQRHQHNFNFSDFLSDIKQTIGNILERVKERFKDILSIFKDGTLSGIFASITTTTLNIFITTQKMIGKLIREMWNTLVSIVKLISFNPQGLSFGDLVKEVLKLLTAGFSLALGVVLNQYLNNLFIFPFGSEIAAFLSALATGIMTLGFTYFLEHSELMQKVWSFLNKFKSKYQHELEYCQKINAELDRYLIELSKIEFNMNADELEIFAYDLALADSEYERGVILSKEIERRNIELPFESRNTESVRSWLKSL